MSIDKDKPITVQDLKEHLKIDVNVEWYEGLMNTYIEHLHIRILWDDEILTEKDVELDY